MGVRILNTIILLGKGQCFLIAVLPQLSGEATLALGSVCPSLGVCE